MTNQVYVVECPSYDQVAERTAQLFEMMGGVGRYAHKGETLALKPNLLAAAAPEKAITTHPSLVAAVGRLVQNRGATALLVESPGSGYAYTESALRRTYEACGMVEAAAQVGMRLNYDTSYRAVFFPEGKLIKHFDIITPLLEADGIVNLCKLKTHAYMGMTGAVKNSFGAIPGLSKPGYHAKLDDKEHFADMLLDLSACVAPRLSIMDAVVGMEGDGPSAGDPRHIGLLLAAENPLALDVVASAIVGLPRESNPVLLHATERGLSPTRLQDVELIGIDLERLPIPGYRLPATFSSGRGLTSANWWQRLLLPLYRDALTVQPRIVEKRCVACGVCVRACPAHAITISTNRHGRRAAHIDDSECIRCYCCHEMCPQEAVGLHKGALYRLLGTWAS